MLRNHFIGGHYWVTFVSKMPSSTGQDNCRRQAKIVDVEQNHLHLAESLGAETARLTGVNIGAEVLAYARLRDVTQVVLGQTQGLRKFLWWWPGSLTAHLLNSERSMDVVIVVPIFETVV
jgi:K+-sensing histidine kinase KdpD